MSHRWLAGLALAALAGALECDGSCGQPSGLETCVDVSYKSCKHAGSSWEIQDQAVLPSVLSVLATYEPALLVDPLNTSDPCVSALLAIECAVAFPVCEIATETELLCLGDCRAAQSACGNLTASFCADLGLEQASGAKCFPLDYGGPAVGMWVLGFLISVVFSFLAALGINLQKYSLAKNPPERASMTQPIWLVGFTLIALGSILDFVAFGLAPQSLLAPLAALSLVWNMLVAPLFHDEKVTRQNLLATAIIFVGVTLTVIFAGHETPEYALDDLLLLFRQPSFIVYAAVVGACLLGMYRTVRAIEAQGPDGPRAGGLLHIICYGGLGGTFGGQSVLLAKSTVELVKATIRGDPDVPFFHYQTYLIVASLVVTLLSQISFLNEGLRRFDALVMVPVYQSFWIVSGVLGGLVYFEEYKSFNGTQSLSFAAGMAVTILGIAVLLRSRRAGSGTVRYTELQRTDSGDLEMTAVDAPDSAVDSDSEDPEAPGSPSSCSPAPSPSPPGSRGATPSPVAIAGGGLSSSPGPGDSLEDGAAEASKLELRG